MGRHWTATHDLVMMCDFWEVTHGIRIACTWLQNSVAVLMNIFLRPLRWSIQLIFPDHIKSNPLEQSDPYAKMLWEQNV